MEAATVPAEKFLVQNNTAGYVGIVRITRLGELKGENIAPFGTAWLTRDEMIETARASQRAEDNPFEEQVLIGVDAETQQRREFRVRPLTLASDESRFVPHERYIPTEVPPQNTSPAPTHAPAETPTPAAVPQSSAPAPEQPIAPPAPPVGAPVAPAPRTAAPTDFEEGQKSWVVEPVAPGQIISGSLAGSNEGAPAPERAPEPTEAPGQAGRFVPSVMGGIVPPEPVGAQPEEHAAVDPQIGEETGSARVPNQPPAEGEYASREEVGSPDAPRQPPTQAPE